MIRPMPSIGGELMFRIGAESLEASATATAPTRLRPAVPAALRDRDPDYIRRSLPPTWPLIAAWFRPDVRDLARFPAHGPVLLVGNHSGGNVAPDTLALHARFLPALRRRASLLPARPPLGHEGALAVAASLATGPFEATWENLRAALESGAAVLVYPGGDWEAHRPSWHGGRGSSSRAGRGSCGWRSGLGVPIVPVVSIGGQETALFLTRGERIARTLGLDRRFRLKVFPVSLALPWGLDVGDLFGHLALPAKITIQVLEPIDLRAGTSVRTPTSARSTRRSRRACSARSTTWRRSGAGR